MEIQSKTCRKCGETKPVSDFYSRSPKSTGGRDYAGSSAGFTPDCKECFRQKMRDHRTSMGQRYKDNFRDWDYRRKFGISLEQYNKMFADQNGCCAICKRHQSLFKHSLAVDHDHVSGVVRSLLCSNCNIGIGNFYDTPDLLKAAIAYLERHSKTNTNPAQVASGNGANGGQVGDEPIH